MEIVMEQRNDGSETANVGAKGRCEVHGRWSQIYFNGNGYTRDERAEDFTLLRSAEVRPQH
jgi:hypothetical protein